MPTRDPTARDQPLPREADGVREPTQPLALEAEPGAGAMTDAVTAPKRPGTQEDPQRALRPIGSGAGPGDPRPGHAGGELGRVLGSYRLVELLGKGGMGYVFRAEHTRLGRQVAIKLLRRGLANRRDAVARFFQEARTVNLARHRNIVDVTDFVELDDGTTYIVMELLTGTSLGSWAAAGVEPGRALAATVQICDGLAAAHQVGVIHRDLKPDNIFIVPTETGDLVKLLDFGIAKLIHHDNVGDVEFGWQTAAGAVIGTPAYMSPEQAGGLTIDPRSDIYSLGAILYELFTGQPVFRGRSFGDFVRKHLTELPVPPSRIPGGAAIDPRLEATILRCLAKDPAQRFATAGELREPLRQLAADLGQPERAEHRSPGAAPAARAALRSQADEPDRRAPLASAEPPASGALQAPAEHDAPHPPRPGAATPPTPAPLPSPAEHDARHPSHARHPPPDPTQPAPARSAAVSPHVPATNHAPPHPPQDHAQPAPAHSAAVSSHVPAANHAPPHPPQDPTQPAPARSAAAAGPPLTLEGAYSLPRPRARRAARWPWLVVSAAVAVLGASAVLRRDHSDARATQQPGLGGDAAPRAARSAAMTTPVAPAPQPLPPSPALIELRFEATPAGAVFAGGGAAEMCRTPCAFNIDPADGGSPTRRDFVVRRAGYADQPIVVDLTGAQRAFHVVLRRAHGRDAAGR